MYTGIIELAVCVDCTVAIANAEFPEETEDRKAVEAGFEREGESGYYWVLASGSEGWFAHSPCDNCRRPLGGHRYPAHLIPTHLFAN